MKTSFPFGVCLTAMLLGIPIASGQVLDTQQVLERQTLWQNRDFDWFQANIPLFWLLTIPGHRRTA